MPWCLTFQKNMVRPKCIRQSRISRNDRVKIFEQHLSWKHGAIQILTSITSSANKFAADAEEHLIQVTTCLMNIVWQITCIRTLIQVYWVVHSQKRNDQKMIWHSKYARGLRQIERWLKNALVRILWILKCHAHHVWNNQHDYSKSHEFYKKSLILA